MYDLEKTFNLQNCFPLQSDARTVMFLKDTKKIQQMCLNANIPSVEEVCLIPLFSSVSVLYIRGSEEYIIKVYDNQDTGKETFPNIKLFTLYSLDELVKELDDGWKYANLQKPTYQAEAEALQSEGLLHGNDNGLDLLKSLSRIEAAAMLLRAIDEGEETTQTTPAFTDVPQTHWGYGAAENAYALGIINGVGNNQFAPDKTVTATEFATMLLRSAKEQNFDWTQAINILIDKGILTEEETKTMDFFTRGDMAKIIYEAQQHGLLKK